MLQSVYEIHISSLQNTVREINSILMLFTFSWSFGIFIIRDKLISKREKHSGSFKIFKNNFISENILW